MLFEKITSRQNPLVKRFRKVRSGVERHHVLIEGIRLVEEAIESGVHFECVAFTSELDSTERGRVLSQKLQHVPCRGAFLTNQLLDYIADTETPQGVVATVTRPVFALDDVFARAPQLIVIADNLQDPGNLGTIARTAEAAGASGLITTPGTVNPYAAKAVRASMGSAFRLPLVPGVKLSDLAPMLKDTGIKVVVAEAPSTMRSKEAFQSKPFVSADMAGPTAIVLGGEAAGPSEKAVGIADEIVYVPMAPGVESLNVSVAAAVLLYEAARQRGFAFRDNIAVPEPVAPDF
ncbi:MAG TPA: RNA methyltransferase [Blastocatellia bacterium]|nr:RNA methyltransferase [Blastocatellia bacterium]